MKWNLRDLERSDRDALAGGVCSGLGKHTPLPCWLWRAIFVALALVWGVGLPIYVVLWVFIPDPDTSTGPDRVA